MNMNESIVKAQQGVWFVVSDIEAAHAAALSIDRPEGRTHADNALTIYLAQLMADARQLQAKLISL